MTHVIASRDDVVLSSLSFSFTNTTSVEFDMDLSRFALPPSFDFDSMNFDDFASDVTAAAATTTTTVLLSNGGGVVTADVAHSNAAGFARNNS
mmetsp:Transcript_34896/g.35446  ORF Transcript_34896/g.35446 Transcript_34896/m.35446 type:complete len:93 (+) Transcript_34896:283-561(+)